MEREDGRALSREALEERRKTIVRMKKAGASPCAIMEAACCARSTIYLVWNRWEAAGETKSGLKVKKRGIKEGERRTLSAEREGHIRKLILDHCPDQLKFDFALWTRAAVGQLIEQEYGIVMPVRTIGEYLRRWGFTPQKPVKYAYERSGEAVREWLEEEYPAIRERAKAEGADIYWGDETTLRSSDVRGRGYAPRGRTPVVKAAAKHENVSMCSAITNQGKVSWMFTEGSFDGPKYREFVERLVCDAPRKVFLIADNAKPHRSGELQAWVKGQAGRVELFYLPAYSPDLNPDEHVNADIKQGVGSKAPVRTKENLRKAAQDHMDMLADMLAACPKRIVRYFLDPAISYAAV
jgi:transposase